MATMTALNYLMAAFFVLLVVFIGVLIYQVVKGMIKVALVSFGVYLAGCVVALISNGIVAVLSHEGLTIIGMLSQFYMSWFKVLINVLSLVC